MVQLFLFDFGVNSVEGLIVVDFEWLGLDVFDKCLIEKIFFLEMFLEIGVEFLFELFFLEIENMEFFFFLLLSL